LCSSRRLITSPSDSCASSSLAATRLCRHVARGTRPCGQGQPTVSRDKQCEPVRSHHPPASASCFLP
jgi:hypothetical protein